MNFLRDAFKQLLPDTPKDTKVILTKNAKEGMGAWGLRESDIRDVVLHGKQVKEKGNMYSRAYNGYSIGIIAKHDEASKTILVLAAWKVPWRK